jgi:hypothetical protein
LVCLGSQFHTWLTGLSDSTSGWTGLPAQGNLRTSYLLTCLPIRLRRTVAHFRLSFPSRLRGSGRFTLRAHSSSLTSRQRILNYLNLESETSFPLKCHFISHFIRLFQRGKSIVRNCLCAFSRNAFGGLIFLLRNCDTFGYTVSIGFESVIDQE